MREITCHSRMFLSGNPIRLKRLIKIFMKIHYVYILASKKDGTLYTGVTNNLLRRVIEHKKGLIEVLQKNIL